MGPIRFTETSLGLLHLKVGRICCPETSFGLLDPKNGKDRFSRNVLDCWTLKRDGWVVPKRLLDCLTLKMGRICFPETSLGMLDPENGTDRLSRNVS